MVWNISYARFIPLEFMFHLSPFCFTRGRAKAKCGGVVDGCLVPNLGRQLLHKHMKCKHQHSGWGLLLTISTSVGKYLYAGEIRVKTHFMSRETHSTDQGKMRKQSENTSQAQLDQNKPMHPSKPA